MGLSPRITYGVSPFFSPNPFPPFVSANFSCGLSPPKSLMFPSLPPSPSFGRPCTAAFLERYCCYNTSLPPIWRLPGVFSFYFSLFQLPFRGISQRLRSPIPFLSFLLQEDTRPLFLSRRLFFLKGGESARLFSLNSFCFPLP